MKIFYDPIQKSHKISHEIIFGKKVRHHERPTRTDVILKELRMSKKHEFFEPDDLKDEHLEAVHARDYLSFLKASQELAKNEEIWPDVFPMDARLSAPSPITRLNAGYYCFDVSTPVMCDTWRAASASAACAVAATQAVLAGQKCTYALARPPGHHASVNHFGGYCYLNNAAISARILAEKGPVLIVDFDFHHGNGTQSIFYEEKNIFFLSIHADPTNEYPYFSGYEHERGLGEGLGYNLNIPVNMGTRPEKYFDLLRVGLDQALQKISPANLVVSAGFDIANNDPLGHFEFESDNFNNMGKILRQLNLPSVLVQEGGYIIKDLGKHVEAFLEGFERG